MINGICFRDAIISGANNLSLQKNHVNDLNIFPVPDGDTGTNMSMTINSAIATIQNLDCASIGDVSELTASTLLRGARGNSGVILSILFRGFADGLEGVESADGACIVNALKLGVDAAYKAVMKPTEGTMLTVARMAYERGREAALSNNNPVHVWDAIYTGALEALVMTPDLLPVLKKAGVVDAGGKGLCLIFEGILSVIKDGIIIQDKSASIPLVSQDNESSFASIVAQFDDEINFTYCTELIIEYSKKSDSALSQLRAFLEKIGDSIVVVNDDSIIKVHVHTDEPGTVIQKGIEFGQLLTVKVENMKEQHRLVQEANNAITQQNLKPLDPVDEVGFVAVAVGDGVVNVFNDLGCLNVVTGGQTMNPSTDDILQAILATPAKTVYVLPNNKNIILAAEQAVPFVKDRKVMIVPSKTIPQGMSAMLAYTPEVSVGENFVLMTEAMDKVSTGQITFASRDSEFGGLKMKEGEIIALDNGKLVFAAKDYLKAAIKLTCSMVKRDTSFITLVFGNGVTPEEAEKVQDAVQTKVGSDIDVSLIDGGQPVYFFIISIE